jgi:hypothetical protein
MKTVLRKVARRLVSFGTAAVKLVCRQFESLQTVGKESLLTAVLLLLAGSVMAYTSPSGSWGQDAYDMVVTNILQGAPGFAGGVGIMAAGAVSFAMQRLWAGVTCCTAGALLMNSETLVTSLGALV